MILNLRILGYQIICDGIVKCQFCANIIFTVFQAVTIPRP